MTERVKVSAPGKLMLFGEHAVIYGKPCIVTAVDQRMTLLLRRMNDNGVELTAPEVGLDKFRADISTSLDSLPKGARFVWASVKNFFAKYDLKSGLSITTESEFSSEFGFGSSSAVTVAVVKGLSEIFEVDLDNESLFGICYKSVLDIQGVGSGFDLAAAIWGGTLLFVTGGKKVEELKVKDFPLVVGYTGIKADTATLVKEVASLCDKYPKQTSEIFKLVEVIVESARQTLIKGDLERLGELANMNQGLLNSLGASSLELENLIFAARKAGAHGAKLSGAGGGDCMIAFANRNSRRKIEEAITKAGGKILNVKTGAEGARIESDR